MTEKSIISIVFILSPRSSPDPLTSIKLYFVTTQKKSTKSVVAVLTEIT